MDLHSQIISMIDEIKRVPTLVTAESNLYTDIGLDSITFIALLLDIEERYSIELQLPEMEECLCVGRLITLIQMKIREGQANE